MNKYKCVILVWVSLVLPRLLIAQEPNWEVDLGQYQFRMSVTAIVDRRGVELTEGNNQVAAFIDGEIRGIGYPSSYHAPSGKYLAIFQIGSNQAEGESITFKIYDEATDEVVESRFQVSFVGNELVGTVSDPLLISDNLYPTKIEADNYSIPESSQAGTLVANLSTEDRDDTIHSYEIIDQTGDENNTYFTVADDQVLVEEAPNHEIHDEVILILEASDSLGALVVDTLTFVIADLNETPTQITLSNNLIPENSAAGYEIGNLSAVDEDEQEEFSYQILPLDSLDDDESFLLDGNLLMTSIALDKEETESYTIQIEVTDKAGNLYVETFSLFVIDVNEPPMVLDTTFSINENLPVDSLIGKIAAFEPDVDQELVFRLVSNGSDLPFRIDSLSGDLFVDGLVDFELLSTYRFTVQVIDNGLPSLTALSQVTIDINDLNDAPTALILTANEVLENDNASTFVGQLETVDQDAFDLFTYQIISVNGQVSSDFEIINNKLFTSVSFDYEEANIYEVIIQSLDKESQSVNEAFEIHILDINEKPELRDTTFQVNENSEIGSQVGAVPFYDQDVGQHHVFTLKEPDSTSAFSISDDGILIVEHPELLDYENQEELLVTIRVMDDGNPALSDESVYAIAIQDVPEGDLPFNNFISPNGDGFNDFFEIKNIEIYAGYKLVIMSASGTVVFRSNNYQNTWDGTYKGEVLPAGVYYFTFKNSESGFVYQDKLYLKSR